MCARTPIHQSEERGRCSFIHTWGLLGGHHQTDHSKNGARIAGATPLPFESSSCYIMITYISADVLWHCDGIVG